MGGGRDHGVLGGDEHHVALTRGDLKVNLMEYIENLRPFAAYLAAQFTPLGLLVGIFIGALLMWFAKGQFDRAVFEDEAEEGLE